MKKFLQQILLFFLLNYLKNTVIFFFNLIFAIIYSKYLDLDNLFGKLLLKNIYLAKECNYLNVNANFKAYLEKSEQYHLVFESSTQKLLPFIYCDTCKGFFNFYKLDKNGKSSFLASFL